MKKHSKLAAFAGVLALSIAPASALATGGGSTNAQAYGKYCQAESKKHVDGQKSTPFSVCVTAMAKLDHGKAANPRTACKDESKKHVDGVKGTPFSLCVAGGRQLVHQQN